MTAERLFLQMLVAFAFATLVACNGSDPGKEYSGGHTTHFDHSLTAFNRLAANCKDFGHAIQFKNGNDIFNARWRPASGTVFDGLGPVFNQNSCNSCHSLGGRGRPPIEGESEFKSMTIHLSARGVQSEYRQPVPLPGYGLQLNDRSIAGVPFEAKVSVRYKEVPGKFPDGETYSLRRPEYIFSNWNFGRPGSFDFSPRVAPFIIGLGLLQSVSVEDIESRADPEDRDGDGISGRTNQIYDKYSFTYQTGRFGWKAGKPSLKEQNQIAFIEDMGITTHLYPHQNCESGQQACKNSPAGSGKPTEASAGQTDELEIYMMLVGVPGRRDWQDHDVQRGEEIFHKIGCESCHRSEMRTVKRPAYPEISDQLIRPYTDLLLHDMGPDLADNRPEHLASGREWRTPPLWGIGLVERVSGHNLLMHDGRARGFQEAILWHGGEGENAKKEFMQLNRSDRQALIRFLESL